MSHHLNLKNKKVAYLWFFSYFYNNLFPWYWERRGEGAQWVTAAPASPADDSNVTDIRCVCWWRRSQLNEGGRRILKVLGSTVLLGGKTGSCPPPIIPSRVFNLIIGSRCLTNMLFLMVLLFLIDLKDSTSNLLPKRGWKLWWTGNTATFISWVQLLNILMNV